MPKYKFLGKGSFQDILKGIYVEEGGIVETRYLLDNNPLFERIDDNPPPYSDFSDDFTLNPGESIELKKEDYFEGLNTLVAYKVAGEKSVKAYLYVDQESDKTDNILDDFSTVEMRLDSQRGIKKLILKADESNSGPITVRISFGWKVR